MTWNRETWTRTLMTVLIGRGWHVSVVARDNARTSGQGVLLADGLDRASSRPCVAAHHLATESRPPRPSTDSGIIASSPCMCLHTTSRVAPPLPPTYQSSGSLHVYIPVPERRGIHPRGQNMVEHMLYISCICPRGMLRESGSGHPDSRTHPHAPAVCTRPAAVAEAPTRRRRSYFFNPCPWRYERVVQQISRA